MNRLEIENSKIDLNLTILISTLNSSNLIIPIKSKYCEGTGGWKDGKVRGPKVHLVLWIHLDNTPMTINNPENHMKVDKLHN